MSFISAFWAQRSARAGQAPPTLEDQRAGQLQYPTFQAQGWPIGSGIVESANKPMVEARLKDAGMHWTRPYVNPLLVLRNAACNDLWDEARALSAAYLRRHSLPRCPVPPLAVTPPALCAAPPLSPPSASPPGPHAPPPTHPWRTYGQKLSATL